ncbi:MAG TPA: hypothetical protein VJ372_21375 [Pyrinomonadaceae bacterium]|jgi:hypothetical protein|nr:hypothetical protein [Pyrinomonadaceae bacterium]
MRRPTLFARLLSILTLLLIATLLFSGAAVQTASATVSGAKPGGGSAPYVGPVTSVIFDYDLLGNQLLMRSDDANGVGQATYTTLTGKGANAPAVNSAILSDGKWQLSMNDQSGRSVWITPNQGIDGSQPTAPPAGYYAIQKAYSVCRDQSENPVPFPNLTNGSGNCSLAVNFFFGGILYKLIMRPDELDGTVCPSGGCPATGLAFVTCNAVSSNQCVNWTITPNSTAPIVGVANLYSYTGPRGTPWVFIGQYNNTFRINAAKP